MQHLAGIEPTTSLLQGPHSTAVQHLPYLISVFCSKLKHILSFCDFVVSYVSSERVCDLKNDQQEPKKQELMIHLEGGLSFGVN